MAFAARFSELDEIAALIKQGKTSPEPSVLRFLNTDMMNTHSYLKFEMSNLNYPGIYIHIVSDSHFGSL